MADSLKPIPLVFWRSAAGREPVREWLNELSREDKRSIGRDIAKVQYGWPVGLPLCRPLSAGLWEVRTSLPSKRGADILRISRRHADRRTRDDQEDAENPGGRPDAGETEI
jgi:Phage derived protein Gp49-like (DUF891)